MSLRIERRTERVDLGDGDWAEVVTTFGVKEAAMVADLQGKPEPERTIGLLKAFVVEWSEPMTDEQLSDLDPEKAVEVIAVINRAVQSFNPKVSSSPSTATSRARGRSRTRTS